jgi:hypothetical protein
MSDHGCCSFLVIWFQYDLDIACIGIHHLDLIHQFWSSFRLALIRCSRWFAALVIGTAFDNWILSYIGAAVDHWICNSGKAHHQHCRFHWEGTQMLRVISTSWVSSVTMSQVIDMCVQFIALFLMLACNNGLRVGSRILIWQFWACRYRRGS